MKFSRLITSVLKNFLNIIDRSGIDNLNWWKYKKQKHFWNEIFFRLRSTFFFLSCKNIFSRNLVNFYFLQFFFWRKERKKITKTWSNFNASNVRMIWPQKWNCFWIFNLKRNERWRHYNAELSRFSQWVANIILFLF